MADASPHIPLAQAWFKATAVASAPAQQSHPHHDPFGSGGKAAVAATEFSCQVPHPHWLRHSLHGTSRKTDWVTPTPTHCLCQNSMVSDYNQKAHYISVLVCFLVGVLDSISCVQMAETMYSCIMLAVKLLAAFCPEAGPQQGNQQGWPRAYVLTALQVSASTTSTHVKDSFQ